ncbi:MAG: hypothetical protein AAF502_02950 [Bacteroidota bacterium]
MKPTISVLFITLFFGFSSPVFSQNSAGDFQAGISGLPIIYLNSNSLDGGALTANVGIFLNANLVAGVRPFFGTVSDGNEVNERIIALGANPYFRVYIGNGKVKGFGDINAGFGKLWYTSKNEAYAEFLSGFDGAMFNLAVGPGIDILLKGGYHIELLIQYLQMQNISHTRNSSLGNTLIPTIGVQKFFTKNQS